MDAVAAVRPAVGHRAQEDDVLALFFHQDVDVVYARQDVGQFGELVVVRGKQGPRADPVVQILDHGPRQAHAVVGAGPPPYLIEDNETPAGRVVQDIGDLLHLHQECAASCGDIVSGADSGEDAVHKPYARAGGGNERSDVRQQRDQRRLAQIGRFTGHVRTGDDQHGPVGGGHVQVVGHVPLAAEHAFDHRVPSGADVQDRGIRDFWLHVPVHGGDLRQGGQDVDVGNSIRGTQQRGGVGRDAVPDLAKQGVLELGDPLLGPQDGRLPFLHRFGDEPLCPDQCLLPDVVRGSPVQIGLTDLNVVPKHFVEPNLQGFDPGARPFVGFQAGNPGLAVRGGMPERIQLRTVAITNHAALLDGEGRLADNSRINEADHVVVRADLLPQALQLAWRTVESPDEIWEFAQRPGQRNKVARIGRSMADPADQALQVGYCSQRRPPATSDPRGGNQVRDGAQALFDPLAVDQRLRQPLPKAACSHGGTGVVQDGHQGAVTPAVSEVTQQFKVAARAGVDDQPAVGRIGHQAPDVRKRAALRLLEVVQERAGGPHGGGEVLASKAIKGGHPQVREEKLAGRGRLESPIWERGKPGPGIGQLVEARRVSFRGQDLSGSQPGQLFCETAVAVLPRNFGDLKLTSGKIGRRHTPDAAWRVRSNQVVIGVVRE